MNVSRRKFIETGSLLIGGSLLSSVPYNAFAEDFKKKVKLCAHLWVYASKFPPNWDPTPVLDDVFSDLQYAGFAGIELMDSVLRHDDSVLRLKALINKYNIGVSGSSYTASMWDKNKHDKIIQDVAFVTTRLHQVGGKTFGITTGNADHKKTEAELDAQADVLKEIKRICEDKGILPNLHNHTWEVENELYELKGMLQRIPDFKLGPDLNWLVRGGVDPVWFVENYGQQMVYMHIRDQQSNGKWTEAVGEGVMDFPAIAKALHKINYNGWAAVELAFDQPPTRTIRENWKISRIYVKKVFGW